MKNYILLTGAIAFFSLSSNGIADDNQQLRGTPCTSCSAFTCSDKISMKRCLKTCTYPSEGAIASCVANNVDIVKSVCSSKDIPQETKDNCGRIRNISEELSKN